MIRDAFYQQSASLSLSIYAQTDYLVYLFVRFFTIPFLLLFPSLLDFSEKTGVSS